MKAIETQYKGYRFRSRLEARWAVFFDALGLDWEYEPEGFVLSDGRKYLPDFRVTSKSGQLVWYEVKPSFRENDGKIQQLSKEGGGQNQSFDLVVGDPYGFIFGGDKQSIICPRCGRVHEESEWMVKVGSLGGAGTEDQEAISYCFLCDMDTPGGASDAVTGLFGVPIVPHKGDLIIEGAENIEFLHSKIFEATQKARKARFEHGEKG